MQPSAFCVILVHAARVHASSVHLLCVPYVPAAHPLRCSLCPQLQDGILIGFCISLSSTAIVLKCLEPSENLTKYGSALLGILIVQDVALGIMLAMLPVLHASGDAILSTLASAVAGFLAVSVLAAFVGWKVLPPVLNFLKRSQELYLLCAICVMMTMLKVTEYLGLSMELGCFIAGLMISTHPDQADYTVHIVEPIRDMFACIFFVTMGLHIYPSFLLSQVEMACVMMLCNVLEVISSWIVMPRHFFPL